MKPEDKKICMNGSRKEARFQVFHAKTAKKKEAKPFQTCPFL
jgi:hypothetical protein